jgi:hypothetical protein
MAASSPRYAASRVRKIVAPDAPVVGSFGVRFGRRTISRAGGTFRTAPRKKVSVALAVLLVGGLPKLAWADARADLEKAHNAYAAHKYDDAETRLRALLDAKVSELRDPENIADARMYLGATLLAEKKNDEAAATFEQLLLEKDDYQPDPLRVSLEAIDALVDARSRLRDRLAAVQAARALKAQEEKAKLEAERQKQALRLAMLEKLATTETVIERHSRWIALVPFGAGQFQNGQTVEGWLFLASEAMLAAGGAVAAGLSTYYSGRATDTYNARVFATASTYRDAAYWAAITGDALAGGLLLVGIAGIVHAQATFVPEKRETRPRAIPPLSIAPIVGPAAAGFVAVARF